MQYFHPLLALATAVSANNYILYCGDSCTSENVINAGHDFSGASCTNLDTAQPYCSLVSDESYYKAIVSKESGCIGLDAEQVIWPGECFEGPWKSYQVSVNL